MLIYDVYSIHSYMYEQFIIENPISEFTGPIYAEPIREICNLDAPSRSKDKCFVSELIARQR